MNDEQEGNEVSFATDLKTGPNANARVAARSLDWLRNVLDVRALSLPRSER